jgi:hypothetical protein
MKPFAAVLLLAGSLAHAEAGRVGFSGGQSLSPSDFLSEARETAAPDAPPAASAAPAPCAYGGALDDKIRSSTFMLVPIKQGIASMTTEQARAYAAKNCGLDTLPVSERMNCRILTTCTGDACQPVYGDHGTAFLLGNGRTLYTAWHVVNETHLVALTFLLHYLDKLGEADRNKTLRNMEPEFVLLNQKEEIVYDTREDLKRGGTKTAYARFGNPLSTMYSQDGRRGDKAYGYEENIPDDFVEIALTRDLGPGFAPASPTGDPNECFVDSGFAFDSRRTTFVSHAGRRATLSDMLRNSGQFMRFELEPLPRPRKVIEKMSTVNALMVMGYTRESAVAQTKQYPEQRLREAMGTVLDVQERRMRDFEVEKNPAALFVDNPIMSGESGGPLLNMNGQVVGLITNGFFYKDEHTSALRSYGGGALRLSSVLR